MNDEIHGKPSGFFSSVYGALVTPDRAFTRERQFTASRFLLFLLIFVLVFSGSVLTQRFNRNETMIALSTEEAVRRIEKSMANAPREQREAAIERVVQSQDLKQVRVMLVAGLVFSSAVWALFVLEIWFLSIILMQFLGGEEQPIGEKKHRRSLYLALYAIIPLALQALVRGIVYYFKDPADISSALSLSEYMEAAEVSFSLLGLVHAGGLAGFAKYAAQNLTNPFCLWTLAVAYFGGRSVFGISRIKMLIAVAVVFVLVGLQNTLFAMIPNMFGG